MSFLTGKQRGDGQVRIGAAHTRSTSHGLHPGAHLVVCPWISCALLAYNSRGPPAFLVFPKKLGKR